MNHDVPDRLARWAAAHDVSVDAMAELQRVLEDRRGEAWRGPAGMSAVMFTLDEPVDVAAVDADSGSWPTGAHLSWGDPLGAGGMSEVLGAFDPRLQRDVAVKVLHPRHAGSAAHTARFVAEARAQARLTHPGVVPIHEIGVLEDGRPYFTMDVNRGRTLREVLIARHDGEEPGLRRLVDVVRRASEVVGFVHSEGLLHRDLKPANIMVGAFGEVQVIDWGLVMDAARGADAGIVGTPAYMAPEQARGGGLTPQTDVYALGAVLYEVVTGRGLVAAGPVGDVIPRVAAAGAAILPPDVPDGLASVVARALQPEPSARYADAGALAEALSDWLDGAARRAAALAVLARADALRPEVEALREEARGHEALATSLGVQVAPWASLDDKADLWAAQDDAERCQRAAKVAERERIDLLVQALSHDPDLPEARRRLAAWHREELVRAEARGDAGAAASAEARLRHHDRGEYAAFLEGRGAVTLVTDPPGATVRLHRLVMEQRRWVPHHERDLGRTPLREVPLARGRWLLTIHAPGHLSVAYPVFVGRLDHWSGVPPGAVDPLPIRLPPVGALSPDDVYVPAGWFRFGDDHATHQAWPASWRWVDGLVVRRFVVTNAEYIAFLDDLVAQGRAHDAAQFVPRAQRAQGDDRRDPVYALRDDGTHHLVPDGDGDQWDPRWPVIQIDWRAAGRFAAWSSVRTGLAWRLPVEAEWEKAARGVDGRAYPWGDRSDATFALMRTSFPDRPNLAPVHDFPHDESIYGVRGMAGGVREWCAERFARPGAAVPATDEAGDRLLRGGCWHFSGAAGRTTARARLFEGRVSDLVGFRLIRSVGGGWGDVPPAVPGHEDIANIDGEEDA